jgi:hypothetical protein
VVILQYLAEVKTKVTKESVTPSDQTLSHNKTGSKSNSFEGPKSLRQQVKIEQVKYATGLNVQPKVASKNQSRQRIQNDRFKPKSTVTKKCQGQFLNKSVPNSNQFNIQKSSQGRNNETKSNSLNKM